MTPEFTPPPAEPPVTPTAPPVRKTGFLTGLALGMAPGVTIVSGLVLGASTLVLASLAVLGGTVPLITSMIRKKSGYAAITGSCALVAGSGLIASAAANTAPLTLGTVFGAAATAIVTSRLRHKNPDMGKGKIFVGAVVGTSLSVLLAATSFNNAAADQKQSLTALTNKAAAALTPKP
ncbi:MAG: hypothetical protein JWO78_91 [Micavibrio sp.]|nr:hypothetical protein [Micavibrio sp.]